MLSLYLQELLFQLIKNQHFIEGRLVSIKSFRSPFTVARMPGRCKIFPHPIFLVNKQQKNTLAGY
jgi:hypothetical protein